MDGPNVIRKDERLVHVVLDIRNSSNKNTTHKSRTLIVKMPPEQPCLDMFGCLIYDTLLLECDHSQVRSLEVNVYKEQLAHKCELSVLWKQAGALWGPLNTAVSLCIGAAPCYCFYLMDCIIIPTLFFCVC